MSNSYIPTSQLLGDISANKIYGHLDNASIASSNVSGIFSPLQVRDITGTDKFLPQNIPWDSIEAGAIPMEAVAGGGALLAILSNNNSNYNIVTSNLYTSNYYTSNLITSNLIYLTSNVYVNNTTSNA